MRGSPPATWRPPPACRLSQIHYHFGSKQGMVLALFEHLNAQLLDRQNAMFSNPTLKLSEQWDLACDYLDDDIASGYVRVLQELIAAGFTDAEVAKVVRAGLIGWFDLITGLARKAERQFGGLGPFSAEEIGALIGSAFIGAESLYLLGAEKKGVPVRQALRRFGDLIRSAEAQSSEEVASCVRSCRAKDGFVERDGVKILYEVYGDGPQTMVFLPPWTHRALAHLQGAAALFQRALPLHRLRCARQRQVRTGPPRRPPTRSTTRSPMRSPSWTPPMPARPSSSASPSAACMRAVLAAHHPDAREGRRSWSARWRPSGRATPTWRRSTSWPSASSYEGWDKFNRDYWLARLSRFRRALHPQRLLRAAFDQADRGRHRMGQRDHRPGAGQDRGGAGDPAARSTSARRCTARSRCPLLLIHGDDDRIQPYARAQAVAEITGAELRYHSGRRP